MTTEEITKNFGILADAVRRGAQSGIIMLHEEAGKCRKCGEHLARVHFNHFHFEDGKSPNGRGEIWWYCDCQCGHGTVTGWYKTRQEAIDAWNKRIQIDANTATVEGR